MSTGKVVLGTLAGIAIGAAVGVLMAPDKGTETRKKILKKKGELSENLKEKYGSLKDKYNTVIDGAASTLESLASKGEEMAQNGANGAQNGKSAVTR
ncbi:MAG: YtxH domain-containing protein [Flavobacterium sp.]|nr:MAG: YtxH domain-containing protein [Flavobacterium sp.]